MPAPKSQSARDRRPKGRGQGRGQRRGSSAAANGKRRSLVWRWRRPLFLVGLMVLTAISGTGYVLAQIELPPERVQAQTSFICGFDVQQGCQAENALARLHAEQDRVNVRLDQVPELVVHAVLAAEDRDFFEHSGVDPVGIARAAWADIRNSGVKQGASTITQQYVKRMYLTDERTFSRKIKEAVLAVKLERELSKKEILERYLNTVYLGRGAYGVAAAAPAYFGKPLAQVNLNEAAYLAGLIRAPELADATRAPEEATRRRRTVLDAMVGEGYITAAQRDEVNAIPWVVAPLDQGGTILPRTPREGFGSVRGAEWGSEYVIEYIRTQLRALGFTDDQIYNGGLRVYTTLDLGLQQAAWDAIHSTLDRPTDPLSALVAIDDNGWVRAMVGGSDYKASKVNLAVGRDGGGSGRQAGSSMKPFVLATAVKQGISLKSQFEAPGEIKIPKADSGKTWTVHNYGGTEQGVLDLIGATRVSSNTAYAQLMMKVKPENVVPIAQQMGITSPLAPNNSLVLGTAEVSPLEMASAYSTFANDGTHITPTIITRVEGPDGTVLRQVEQPRAEVFTKAENDLVTYALRQPLEAGGTAAGARFGQPAAGKTGTTQDNRDAWFVGFLPNGWTAAVWMGYDVDPESKEPRFMNSVHGRAVTGGSFPATIWRKFMKAWTDGSDAEIGRFDTPKSFPGKVLNKDLVPTPTTGADGQGGGATTTTAPSGGGHSGSTTTTSAPDDGDAGGTSTSTTGPAVTVPTTVPR